MGGRAVPDVPRPDVTVPDVTGPEPPEPGGGEVRASDAEREATVTRLQEALAEGRLSPEEFSTRLDAAYSARTLRQLDELVADLPRAGLRLRPVDPSAGREPVRRSPRSEPLARQWGAWASASLVCTVIWLIVLVTGGGGDTQGFWPLWVAGPWGAVLLARTLFGSPSGRGDR